ncbi:hypothetical protein NP493_122g04004 [Ridgeia piscesae]|uniref:Uncharacterized protein n=1 Tax=Ridgeia piscesae TaxID=27915 RepID=A0AAD9P651_RIDPI|nr:hypothetical protein NP493_122g04004 [Ridgeia piscesae]
MTRVLFVLLGFASVFLGTQARTRPAVPDNVFQSDNTSTDNDGRPCHGMPCDQWQRVQRKMLQFRASAAAADGLQFDIQNVNETMTQTGNDRLENCILLTEEQIDELLELQEEQFFNGGNKRRRKPDNERKQVRSTLRHWSEQTCVRFSELGVHEHYDGHHIIFTYRSSGCYSYIGKVNLFPQPVNLRSSCFDEMGSGDGSNVIETLNPLYQRNMGQRVGLSFLTSKLINFAYCNDTCKTKLPQPCLREGYQDPNHCDRCRCPDGFSGKYCQDVAPPVNGNCGGKFVATYTPQTISTPGYNTVKYYENKQECNWLLSAPANHTVELRFEDEFGLYAHTQGQCYHWVEVHYGKHFGSPGPRFCSVTRPDKTVTIPLPGVPRIQFPSSPSQKSTTPAPKTTTTVDPFSAICGPVDLAFLIDSSGSIGKTNWPKMLNFMKKLSSKLTVSPDRARIAVVSFGNEATLHFGLDSHVTLKSTEAAIDQIGWKGQWTNTGAALRVMKDHVFKKEHGDRSNVPNVAVLITDGPSNKNSWQTVPNAESARNAGINIFVIGVGSGIDPIEMKDISGLTSTRGMRTTPKPTPSTTTEPTLQTGRKTSWQCDFEGSAGEGSTCDMVQCREDTFDWTLKKGATPSRPTGPDSGYRGKYYIYIEASRPRKYGDRAIMLFPSFSQESTFCVKFNYHMFGYHINELQLAKRSSSGHLAKVWSMVGEKGNRWLSAEVNVELTSSDQVRLGQRPFHTQLTVSSVRRSTYC